MLAQHVCINRRSVWSLWGQQLPRTCLALHRMVDIESRCLVVEVACIAEL